MGSEIRGIKDFYNDIAQEFSDMWYANESLLPVLREFVSLLGPSPRVLDLGCGAGYESMRLHRLGAEVVGVDYSEEPIKIAREKNPDCQFHVLDFREMYGSLGKFDGIAAIASLIHINDTELELIFRNMKKVLKECGFVMAVVIEGEGVSTEKSRLERNCVLYDRTFWLHRKERLDQAAGSAGLQFFKEITLPDELAAYEWKCFVYSCKQIYIE